MNPEYQDLIEEREDIKRQRTIVVANTEQMKSELRELHRAGAKSFTRLSYKYAALREENTKALRAMDARLSVIKARLQELGGSNSFEGRFLIAARKLLDPETFRKVEQQARDNYAIPSCPVR